MARISGDLTDVVNMFRHFGKSHPRAGGSAFSFDPTRPEHPGIERRPDDRAPLDQRRDLVVAELTMVRHQRASVPMAGPDRTVEVVLSFPKTFIAKMGRIENDPEPVHLLQQFAAGAPEPSRRIGALRIRARAIMGRANRPQPLPMRALKITHRL